MNNSLSSVIIEGLRYGTVVPYLGPGILQGVSDIKTGEPMPAQSDELILAMNNGRAMSPRLMYEFPRAAMHLEQRRGRPFLERFLTHTYGERQWTRSRIHDWIADIKPPYVIDINRDTQLQDSYSCTPHLLVVGVASAMGGDYRFRIFHFDGKAYRPIAEPAQADWTLPILFKPMGTPRPEPHYIASDADYVDYLTELMGGFAIPPYIKQYRDKKQYLLLGMRLNRDTERMVLADMIYSAHQPSGWAVIAEPSPKERRFCAKLGLEIIETSAEELVGLSSGNIVSADIGEGR